MNEAHRQEPLPNSMADEVGSNGAGNAAVLDMLAMVMAKMDTLSDSMSTMSDKMDSLNDKVSSLDQRISSVEKSQEYLKGHLSDHATNSTTYNIVEQARSKLASVTCFNNDYNIVFFGVPGRSDMSIDDAFRRFMVDRLHFKEDEAMSKMFSVQNMAKLTPQDEHVPICVSCTSESDAFRLRSKAMKYSKELLQSGIYSRWTYTSGLKISKS